MPRELYNEKKFAITKSMTIIKKITFFEFSLESEISKNVVCKEIVDP